MKKIIFTLLSITGLFAATTVQAQYCGSASGHTATGAQTTYGFQPMDSLPCIVQGGQYEQSIQFKMFTSFYYPPLDQSFDIDSLKFEGFDSLPCGICWAADKASNIYYPNEDGSLTFKGLTSDAAGQYKLYLKLRAYLNGGVAGGNLVQGPTVDASGIKMFVRVIASGGNCAPVDTVSGHPYLTGNAANCTNGINDLENNLHTITIAPNPMANKAIMTFTSDKNIALEMTITDITGKTVDVKQVNAVTGVNTVNITRGQLPAGMYFVVLNDGKTNVTTRFSITE